MREKKRTAFSWTGTVMERINETTKQNNKSFKMRTRVSWFWKTKRKREAGTTTIPNETTTNLKKKINKTNDERTNPAQLMKKGNNEIEGRYLNIKEKRGKVKKKKQKKKWWNIGVGLIFLDDDYATHNVPGVSSVGASFLQRGRVFCTSSKELAKGCGRERKNSSKF